MGGGVDVANGGTGDADVLMVNYATETSNILSNGSSFSDFVNTQVTFTNIERFRISLGSGNDSVVTVPDGMIFLAAAAMMC